MNLFSIPNSFASPPHYQIRPAMIHDCGEIFRLVSALARFEKLAHEVVSDPRDYEEALFGDRPVAGALVAEPAPGNRELVGFALYVHTYSTFLGRPGIYLEDVYVEPPHRGSGLGKALLQNVAKIGKARGCGRMDWCVLDWNTPAIAFYESLGASLKREWIVTRLDREGIETLAEG